MPAANQNNVAGRVTGVNGSSLSVQNIADGTTITVVTSGTTVFTKIVAGTMNDLKMNDFVAVQGDKTGDNAYTARTITGTNAQANAGAAAGGFPGAGGGRPADMGTMTTGGAGGAGRGGAGGQIVGRIAEMSGDTVTLNSLDGSVITVTTTPMTKVQTTQSAALSDIKTGDSLIVVGERTGDNVTARLVTDQGA